MAVPQNAASLSVKDRHLILVHPLVAILAFATVAAACASPPKGAVVSDVEGALRARFQSIVAPKGYVAGTVSDATAEDWMNHGNMELGRWYADPALAQHERGLRNLVDSLRTTAGPIPTAVDVTAVKVGTATIEGTHATVTDSSIWYVTHYAPGTWIEAAVSGVTWCQTVELVLSDGAWRVTSESCNESGG